MWVHGLNKNVFVLIIPYHFVYSLREYILHGLGAAATEKFVALWTLNGCCGGTETWFMAV